MDHSGTFAHTAYSYRLTAQLHLDRDFLIDRIGGHNRLGGCGSVLQGAALGFL